MKITICVGSTCHLLGSKRVVDKFKELVSEHHLDDKVELAGKFCMGKCGEGVCVTIDGVTVHCENFCEESGPKTRRNSLTARFWQSSDSFRGIRR